MKVGVLLPTGVSWSEIAEQAARAEEVGLDSVWVADHLLLGLGPGVEAYPSQEAWTTIAALAARTRRVELGTLVTCVAYRNPALLAKMAVGVDEISGGRVILGLGGGWLEPEFLTFGYPFDHRVGRFDEAMTILRALLREGQVDFAGTYHEARECALNPRGPRPSTLPIMIGAMGDRMLKIAVRDADLWNGCFYSRPDELEGPLATVDAACEAGGRDPASLARTAAIYVDLPGRHGRPFPGDPPILDSPDAIADLLAGFAATGLVHVQVWPDPWSNASIETLGRAAEIFRSSTA